MVLTLRGRRGLAITGAARPGARVVSGGGGVYDPLTGLPDLGWAWLASAGVTLDTVPDPDEVTDWLDQVASLTVSATPGGQPQFAPAHPELGGAAIDWDTGGAPLPLRSAAVVSGLSCLHDGTGVTLLVDFHVEAGASNGGLLDTNNISGTGVGAFLRASATHIEYRAVNAAGTVIQLRPALSAGRHIAVVRYASTSPESYVAEIRVDGVQADTQASESLTPSAAAPGDVLALGGRASSVSQVLDGAIAELHVCTSWLDDADVAAWEAYTGALP